MAVRKHLALALLLALGLSACASSEPPQAETPPTRQTQPEAPEPTLEEQQQAAAEGYTEKLTLEQQTAQLFFARCPDTDAAAEAAEYSPGGYILFGRDFDGRTREQVQDGIASCQAAAAVPMLIGVDEEGGTVTRASRDPKLFAQPLPSPQELYAARGMDGLAAETLDYNERLLALGINVNLAPVCDVSTDAGDFIYARSFGGDAAATSEFVTAAVGAIRDAGVAAVLKHFPGYGNNADTHTGVAIDKRPYETFEQSDFLPFQAGIAAGAPFVLVSHNVAECMDAALPASLSPAVHEVLRETLGFDGIVITDDLAMDAVKQYANGEAAVLAVLAGNDMLITSDYQSDIPAVLAAVADGRIAEREIDAHVLRILRYKQAQGWIE